MQHMLRFVTASFDSKRIDSVCGVTWIPLCSKHASVITWGRGEGETLSHHVVSTQCAEGLTRIVSHVVVFSFNKKLEKGSDGTQIHVKKTNLQQFSM